MSRGYLPIVALTDPQHGGQAPTSPTTSPSNWRATGKGKGNSKSGKSKSKSKTTIRYPPQGAGHFDPKGRAKANMTCLSCGQPGHWAANCPQKRRAPSTTEGMALQTTFQAEEMAMLLFQDQRGNERPDCVMLDPGASAFLSGYGPFKRYLDHLKTFDFPIESIKMSKGRRRFQFGGDAALWSDWSAHLPTFIDGKFGTIELFLLPGGTPMLCGRPIIEALGITMDFARKRLRFGASRWVEATLGRQGEYLWSLTSEHDNMYYDINKPDFELRTADPDVKHVDGYHLTDFLDAEHGFLNNLSAFVSKELHRPERPRVLWEVYCGTARTSQVAESMGMEVRRFSYETGWDFDRLDHQQQFLILLEEEQPDEVLVTPECKLWSRMQSLGRRTWHQQEALIAARERHHDRHLMFTKRIYMAQINGGRRATVEQPKHALSWRTRALRDLLPVPLRCAVLGHRWHLAPSEKRHHSPHEQALSAGRYEFVRLQLLPELYALMRHPFIGKPPAQQRRRSKPLAPSSSSRPTLVKRPSELCNGEFKLAHQEPRAAQHHDVVILELLEVGVAPQCPEQGEVKGVFAFRWSQSPFDAADGIFHAEFGLDGNVSVANHVLSASGTEVKFGRLVTAGLERRPHSLELVEVSLMPLYFKLRARRKRRSASASSKAFLAA